MKFIKVTSSADGKAIFINPEMIGSLYPIIETGLFHGEVQGRAVTKVAVVTHNNGGFSVLEKPEEIIEMIKNLGE